MAGASAGRRFVDVFRHRTLTLVPYNIAAIDREGDDESVTQPGGPDPTGDGSPAAGQDGAEEQPARPGAERRSSAEASRENHWHGAGIGCEDVMAGSVRGDGLVW